MIIYHQTYKLREILLLRIADRTVRISCSVNLPGKFYLLNEISKDIINWTEKNSVLIWIMIGNFDLKNVKKCQHQFYWNLWLLELIKTTKKEWNCT